MSGWPKPASGGGGAVSSVFTRTGAVVATTGDYTVAKVTGAAPLASPALTGLPSINGSVLAYVSPSGDTTGVTDTTNIQNSLNAGYTVLLGHNPGTFYVTNITLTAGATIRGAGSGLTVFLPGSSASGSVNSGSMFYYAGTASVFLSGFTCNGQDGVYNYLLNFTALGSFAADFPIIDDCQFNTIYGTGLYYGGNRGGLRASNCSFSACSTVGAYLGGSDIVLDHPEVSYNGIGLHIYGSMTRVHDMDCYYNNFGVYVHIPQVWIVRASFDQNSSSGVVVDTNASTVFISARFTSNGLATNNTYPNVDIHAAAALGVTLLPDTFFLGLAFGHTNVTTYDVYTNGVTFYDYSQYAGTSSASGHTDLANFQQSLLTQLGAPSPTAPGAQLARVTYAPASIATYTITASVAALDTTNLTISFVAPPSGQVVLRAVFPFLLRPGAVIANSVAGFALFVTHSTTTPVSAYMLYGNVDNAVTGTNTYLNSVGHYEALVTGLTPRTTYQYDFAAIYTAGGTPTTVIITADNGSGTTKNGPLFLYVIAA